MIKYPDQGSLQKEEFIWAYRSKSSKIHHDRDAWQQACVVLGEEIEKSHPELQAAKQRAIGSRARLHYLKSPSPVTSFPSKAAPRKFPKQLQQLGSKCLNTWAYGDISHSKHHTEDVRQLVEGLSSIHEALGLIPSLHKLGVVPGRWNTGGLGIQVSSGSPLISLRQSLKNK